MHLPHLGEALHDAAGNLSKGSQTRRSVNEVGLVEGPGVARAEIGEHRGSCEVRTVVAAGVEGTISAL